MRAAKERKRMERVSVSGGTCRGQGVQNDPFYPLVPKVPKVPIGTNGTAELATQRRGGQGRSPPPVSSRSQKSQMPIGGTGPIWDRFIALLLRLSQKKRGQHETRQRPRPRLPDMHREDRRLDRARRAVPGMGAEGWRGLPAMNGKGSARMRSSDARRYADGWRRVFGGGRGRRDSGGKEGYGGPLTGPSRSVGG